jgi:hypothetical protein
MNSHVYIYNYTGDGFVYAGEKLKRETQEEEYLIRTALNNGFYSVYLREHETISINEDGDRSVSGNDVELILTSAIKETLSEMKDSVLDGMGVIIEIIYADKDLMRKETIMRKEEFLT